MISAFEHIQSDAFSDDASHLERERILKKRAERLAQLSFVVNLVCVELGHSDFQFMHPILLRYQVSQENIS